MLIDLLISVSRGCGNYVKRQIVRTVKRSQRAGSKKDGKIKLCKLQVPRQKNCKTKSSQDKMAVKLKVATQKDERSYDRRFPDKKSQG